MLFLGIDPGSNGGFGVVDESGAYVTCNHVNALGPGLAPKPELACIEAQSNRRCDAPGAQYGLQKLLIHYGKLMGILEDQGVRFRKVYPMSWRSRYKLVKAPWRALIARVQEMWPEAPIKLKKDDGKAVGLLLADYARLIYQEAMTT